MLADLCCVADTLKQNVVPLVCKYCDKALQSEERSLLSVVKNFGRFCHMLSGMAGLVVALVYLDFYFENNVTGSSLTFFLMFLR